jgi:hypothetical protein
MRAYRVSARPLCRYLLTRANAARGADRLWGSTASARSRRSMQSAGKSFHRLQLPSRVSPTLHRKHPAAVSLAPARRPLAPSEVLSPSASCQPWGATHSGEFPPHPVTLRPQGYAPSRRLAPPMACQACFIPAPLMGFALRGFALPGGAVRPLGRRLPPGVGPDSATLAPPSGLVTPPRIPPGALGFSQTLLRMPPWASAPPGFLAPRRGRTAG